jgi:hypothetical protein
MTNDKTKKIAMLAIMMSVVGIASGTVASVYHDMLIQNSIIDGATITDSQFTGNLMKNITMLNQTINYSYYDCPNCTNGTNGINGTNGTNGILQNDTSKFNVTGGNISGTVNFTQSNPVIKAFSGYLEISTAISSLRIGSNAACLASNCVTIGNNALLFTRQSANPANFTNAKGGLVYNTTSNQTMIGGVTSFEYIPSTTTKGLTQNISVLTALPSTFTTLEFKNGILIGII